MWRFLLGSIAVAGVAGAALGAASDPRYPNGQPGTSPQPPVIVRPSTPPPRPTPTVKKTDTKPASSGTGQLRSQPPLSADFLRQKAEAERRHNQQAAARQKAAAEAAAARREDLLRSANPIRPLKTPHTDRPSDRDLHSPDYRWVYDPYYGWVRRSRWNPYGYDPYYGYSPYGNYPYDSGYGSYGYSPYTYGTGYSPYAYPRFYSPWGVFPPPVFMPAGELFGPGPILRMMGLGQGFNPGVANPQAQVPRADPAPRAEVAKPERRVARRDDPDNANPDKPAPKAVGQAAALAERLIGFGDTRFSNRQFSDAYDRYKRAAIADPKMADAWFRQGIALAAMGRYGQAAKAIKRGLELNPDWADSEFKLDDVFSDDQEAKHDRLAAMMKAAEDDAHNGDLMYLVGVYLWFDGQREKAAGFFKRASEIGGNDGALKGFVKDEG